MINRDKMILIHAEKIRKLMEYELIECLQEVQYNYFNKNLENDKRRFSNLKILTQLTTELLVNEDIKEKILELANQSNENGNDNVIKLEIFEILRNIISHFACFETYEEIVLSREILTWNCPKNSKILNFFDKHDGEKIVTKIFYKFGNEPYKEIKQIKIEINKIKENEEVQLSSIISLNNAIWLFGIINYYLDYLGLKIEPQYGLSI